MTSVYIDGDNEFVNINGGDGDNDGREGDRPEPPQTRRAPLREQPTPILDGKWDLKQKMEHVLRNLCSGQYGPLLLQFWTLIKTEGLFFLKTQTSHSFLVTPNDLLRLYWKSSEKMNPKVDGLPGVSMFDGDGAFTYLWLPVYFPVREQGFYEENYVGMLQIASNTKETCLQFFKEARVCDLFQKDGLICSDVVPQHLGMQLDVSTQGSEVPSNFSVDHTGQFPTKEVFNSKDQLVNWARDVGMGDNFMLLCSYGDNNIAAMVDSAFTYTTLATHVCERFGGTSPNSMSMFFRIARYNKFNMENELDFQNMLSLVRSFQLDYVDVIIELRGESSGDKRRRANGDNSYSGLVYGGRSGMTEDVDGDDDLLPNFCPHAWKSVVPAITTEKR